MRSTCRLVLAVAAATGLLYACTAEGPDFFEIPAPRFKVEAPFTATGSRLGIYDGRDYAPIFVKAVNLGVGVPGTFGGELAATNEQYQRWFEQMGALGLNAVRVYTLHYPRFYDELARYNSHHRDKPLYLLQGVYLDDNDPTLDLYDLTGGFDDASEQAVRCIHGDCEIPQRFGAAFGRFRADVSQWVLGFILGRDLDPNEIVTTDMAHPNILSFYGNAFKLNHGSPTEAWFAERMDRVVTLERRLYGVERPISVSNRSSLDPIIHPTESAKSLEDLASLDLASVDATNAPAGMFVSYSAYPYFPDFMTRDSHYQRDSDSMGPNTYIGYLRALRAHYASQPLLITEFGVPSSWGNAHFGAGGMNYGGQDETQQGDEDGRLLRDLYEADCAGGALSTWIDEWWRRNWIVDDLALPHDRYPLWHNIASPDQNFGLIAFDLASPTYASFEPVTGTGRVAKIEADANAAFFFTRITLTQPLGEGETLTLGFDTYGDKVGESMLPSGVVTKHRNEFALQITPPDTAKLLVTQAYDMYGERQNIATPEQLFHSVASDGAMWMPVRWRNNDEVDPGTPNPGTTDEIGTLVARDIAGIATSRDAVVFQGARIHIRIPWTLLLVADPSQLRVIDDDRITAARETASTSGIAISTELGGDVLETGRFRWQAWDQVPATTERVKPAYAAFGATVRALP